MKDEFADVNRSASGLFICGGLLRKSRANLSNIDRSATDAVNLGQMSERILYDLFPVLQG
jgi:hypothetical protein